MSKNGAVRRADRLASFSFEELVDGILHEHERTLEELHSALSEASELREGTQLKSPRCSFPFDAGDLEEMGAGTAKPATDTKSGVSVKSCPPELHSVWVSKEGLRKGTTRMLRQPKCQEASVFTRHSGALVRDDQVRLQRFMVRPHSIQRLTWDIIAMALLFYDLMYFPVTLAFGVEVPLAIQWSVALFWTLDILLSFSTGYHSRYGLVEMRPYRIAQKYIKTWFVPDLAVVAADWLVVLLASDEAQPFKLIRLSKSGRSIRILKVLKFVRVVRTAKVSQIKAAIFVYIREERCRTIFNIFLMLVMIIIANHYIGCGWYVIGSTLCFTDNWLANSELDADALGYLYTTSLHWSLTQFTPASMELHPHNLAERTYAVCILLFGMLTFTSFVSSISSWMSEMRRHQSEMDASKRELRAFLYNKHVSVELYQRIWNYVKLSHWTVKGHIHEKDLPILKTLPATLSSKLRNELFVPTLTKAPFLMCFSNLSPAAMTAVCFKAITESSLFSSQELFTFGEVAFKMYFVTGGIARYTHSTGSMTELSDDQWACEPAVWMKWTHCGNVVARTFCELLELDVEAFQKAVGAYDSIHVFLSNYAVAFHKLVQTSDTWATDLWKDVAQLEHMVTVAAGEETNDLPASPKRFKNGDTMTTASSTVLSQALTDLATEDD